MKIRNTKAISCDEKAFVENIYKIHDDDTFKHGKGYF